MFNIPWSNRPLESWRTMGGFVSYDEITDAQHAMHIIHTYESYHRTTTTTPRQQLKRVVLLMVVSGGSTVVIFVSMESGKSVLPCCSRDGNGVKLEVSHTRVGSTSQNQKAIRQREALHHPGKIYRAPLTST